MSDSVDQLLSQALLEQLGPLINRVDKQLRDLAQVQVLLQGDIAEISGELESTQTELDRVHDTFARLPHYVAKVTAMKNTIASVTTLTKKLKRRASQVAVSREKQAVRAQVTKAKEQAYDQTIAAVQAAPSTPTRPSISRQASTSTIPVRPHSPASERPNTPTRPSSTLIQGAVTKPAVTSSTSSSTSLPFPLPTKPAIPAISAIRPSSRPGTPPSHSPGISPRLSGKPSSREATPPPTSESSVTAIGTESEAASEQGEQVARVDLFPQVSSIGAEVEVVRVRRKKVVAPKSSASSIASTSTTASKKTPSSKTKSTRSAQAQQSPSSQSSPHESKSEPSESRDQ
ncbi:hypothetical protein B0O80DRAFT_494785 [Mortierella sp. GBAus27b]|nr:hypothetical protein B0O80DRAFT_494785 [Mortierella sp. GBAus27b]